MQLLSNKLYELLHAAHDKGAIPLPPPQFPLPREKPVPEAVPLTRWERFAKEKGIVKKKRSKMVWDEATQLWAPRYGFGRANNPKESTSDWLVEAKPGDDGSVDPFEAKADERKMRLSKQKKQEERNRLEAAHAASSRSSAINLQKDERRQYLSHSIAAAQVSTASAGRFDKTVANEPSKNKGKRQHYETATSSDDLRRDAQRTASVVSKMFPENKGLAINREVAARETRKAAEETNRRAKTASAKSKAPSKPGKTKAAKGAIVKSGKGKGMKGKGKGKK
eukprot:CAMPEP_0113265360 /NCGR_PEP_ID=MMETSP0008_2-20120614/19457_1 /TAXON_ID=97485 /ORGANISM="Prymnesium parvum" /LENGTH=279 /DNA_ID=CAMNT_0000114167 /DNA_START=27 /DNA_END=866 /DNA_ORIENTATION=+ /assembly_acc=CAM_ASM_000153